MHLHIDCPSGLAGDMLMGALIDAGVDAQVLQSALAKLPLGDFELHFETVHRSGLKAIHVDVVDHSHGEHHHGHGEHEHHGHHHHHGPHRHLADLVALANHASLPATVRERAAKIFLLLAQAEAKVHGKSVEEVHFHEISGIDTAVDVIGCCLALEQLAVTTISATPPAVGNGLVKCAHGVFPVPAPATLEILRSAGIPWHAGKGEGERLTPTGAALLAGLVGSFQQTPGMVAFKAGYGGGKRDTADIPNIVRVVIGELSASAESSPWLLTGGTTVMAVPATTPFHEIIERPSMLPDSPASGADRVAEFRFNVDDMTPEAISFLCEACFTAGAVEAYVVPAGMKKSRMGHQVTVLSPPDRAAAVVETIWKHSTTFGMRVSDVARLVLSREVRTITVMNKPVRIKLGWYDGKVIRSQPEYEDCRTIALSEDVSLATVFRMAIEEASKLSEDTH